MLSITARFVERLGSWIGSNLLRVERVLRVFERPTGRRGCESKWLQAARKPKVLSKRKLGPRPFVALRGRDRSDYRSQYCRWSGVQLLRANTMLRDRGQGGEFFRIAQRLPSVPIWSETLYYR